MFDASIFDAWKDMDDCSAELQEMLFLTRVQIEMIDAVHGSTVAAPIVRQLAEELKYGSTFPEVPFEQTEVGLYLAAGDAQGALSELLTSRHLVTHKSKFAVLISGLRCYVATGLLLPRDDVGAAYSAQLLELQGQIDEALLICASVPVELVSMPRFRILASAAEARLTLDLGHAVDVVKFAALASFFRDGTPEQIRKTLQNQIAAQQLAVNDQRQLMPDSAMQFLRGAGRFPSLWLLPDSATGDGAPIEAPVFVPVCPPLFGRKDCPFLPGERHEDGYHVGSGDHARVIADYWEALDWLTKSPEPAFQPRKAAGPMRCKTTWIRVSASELTSTAS
jgi:hypothetical protein